MSLLTDLAAVRGTDLTSLDDAGLASLGSLISRGRRDLAAFATAVVGEAKRRQEAGSSPSPEDLSDPERDRSARARAKDEARGEIRHDLPETGESTEAGTAKTENADHLASKLARLSATEKQRLAGHDRDIAARAASMPPEMFAAWLARLLVRLADRPEPDGLSAAERARARAAWTMFRRPDGTWAIAGSMDDERGMSMDAAVTARAREIANQRPPGQRQITANDRATAAHQLLCGIMLGGTTGPACDAGRAGASATAVVDADGAAAGSVADDRVMGPNLAVGIIVDAATLVHGPHAHSVAETWHGHPLDPLAAQRRCCDADWYTIIYDALGRPTRVPRTRRYATREQRLQLRGLYPTCPLDQTTPFARCEIHHVNLDYELGGETELHNLVPISTEWHHRIHDGGWTLTMDPDRTLQLHRPDGTLDRIVHPPTPITRQTH